MVTFVIPTIGRQTLSRSLSSLIGQEDPDWRAVVVYDGVLPPETGIRDHRICDVLLHSSIGSRNVNGNGGLVRNQAFPIVTTDWVAFLDDDDAVTSDYVTCLKQYAEGNDVVVFRMIRSGEVIPAPDQEAIVQGRVGISFAVRKKFIDRHGLLFQNGDAEDYGFLTSCIDSGARWSLVPNITYLVGGRFE